MKRQAVLIALVAALAVCLSVLGCAQQPASSDSAITVSADATLDIAPDQAAFALHASAQGTTNPEAEAAGRKLAADIVERLEELGVPEADIDVTGIELSERFGTWSVQQITDGYFDEGGNWVEYVVDEIAYDGTHDVVGYDVDVRIQVARLNPSDLAVLARSMREAGVTRIDDLSFTVTDRQAAYRQALAAAVEAAHTKAEALAKASSVYVGRVVNVQEDSSADFEATVAGDPASVDLSGDASFAEPATVPVTAAVTVSYAIS